MVNSADQYKMALRELNRIGLSTYEARAYIALLSEQPANGYDLAKSSGIPTSKIYETLGHLVSKGVALASASEPTLYQAIPPAELIANFRRQTEQSLDLLASTLPDLVATPSAGVVWRLNDQEVIFNHLKKIVLEATREIYLSIWPSEAGILVEAVTLARQKGIRLWVASFGTSPLDGTGVYDLLSCGSSSAARLGKRLTAAVADSRHVLIAEFSDDAAPRGTLADDAALALVAKEYIIHDLANHALIEELGQDRFATLCRTHPLLSGLLGSQIT
jgi:predicted transcriptional regulator